MSFHNVFEERLQYLLTQKNRSSKTIADYRSIYNRLIPPSFGDRKISEITQDEVFRMIQTQCAAKHPKPDALKKVIQYLKATFEYAVSKGYCAGNPAAYLDPSDYYKDCNLAQKQDEEKEFSPDEISLIMESCEKDVKNPRALMAMMAKETGMRMGELAALHRSDIEDSFIHIHRRQLESIAGRFKA